MLIYNRLLGSVMRLLTFEVNGVVKVGLYTGRGIVDLPKAYLAIYEAESAPEFLYSMRRLIEIGEPALRLISELGDRAIKSGRGDLLINPASINWLPPVTDPEKILCVAVNYRAHGEESSTKPPERPYFFPKFRNALIGNGQPIVKPKASNKVDWEVELGVVIGRRGKYIDVKDAFNHVFGYVVTNDISMRDWQFPSMGQFGMDWIHGKSMDGAMPVGPYVVTRDEVPDPHNLRLTLRVNGVVEQDGNTRDLIFKIPELIHWASQGITLKPGDYISTGTPAGVGFPKGKFLKHGDVVEAEVEGIGLLRNPVVNEE